jgi:hypothetical protein
MPCSLATTISCAAPDKRLSHRYHIQLHLVLQNNNAQPKIGLCLHRKLDSHVPRPRVLTWMRRTFAGAFAALGAKLALSDR